MAGLVPALPAGGVGETAASPKLAKGAREFESILLASWLEKMEQSFAGEEQNQDPARDSLVSLRTQAVASAWAARGGIGVARQLLKQLAGKEDGRRRESTTSGPVRSGGGA